MILGLAGSSARPLHPGMVPYDCAQGLDWSASPSRPTFSTAAASFVILVDIGIDSLPCCSHPSSRLTGGKEMGPERPPNWNRVGRGLISAMPQDQLITTYLRLDRASLHWRGARGGR